MSDPDALPLPAGGFDHAPRTRLLFGNGVAAHVGRVAKELGASRVFLVTDPGIVRAGHVDEIEDALNREGIGVLRYEQAHENPNSDHVEACAEEARSAADFDLFVGLGGGSAIDTAKGANFLLTNGGRMEDYWGRGKAHAPLLPLIAIPTTAGTGTEVQSFTLIERASDHQKMACGADSCAPRVAILDPTLTLTMPRAVTAATGLDTIGHAVESYVTRKRNAISSMYAREAWVRADRAFERVLRDGGDLEARGEMLLAAALAGLAIENSMLGAAHSLANPLTAHYPIAHGQAVGIMLPHVVAYNAGDPRVAGWYRKLAAAAGLCGAGDSAEVAAEALGVRLRAHRDRAGCGEGLRAFGVEEPAVGALAEEAERQWTAQFNPRVVDRGVLAGLYQEARGG